MDFKEFPIPFVFYPQVTAEELRESFLNINTANIEQLAEVLSEEIFEHTPEKAFKRRPFSYFPDGKKYVSFMSRPQIGSHVEDWLVFDKVFGENFQDGLQNYVALLSNIINSAPGEDSRWPYGRYYLQEIDEGIHNKLIGNAHMLFDVYFSDTETSEATWQQISKFHQLNLNIRAFGLLLCNFKNSLTMDNWNIWENLLHVISKLEDLDNPEIDKVAVRQTAQQIINNYITVRKNTFDQDQLSKDIQKFKDHLKFVVRIEY